MSGAEKVRKKAARRRVPPRDLQLARDAVVLLNEAVRRLLIPRHLYRFAEQWRVQGASESYEAAMKNAAMLNVVLGVVRLHEIREHYLMPLLGAKVVEALGPPSLPSFVGDWDAFVQVRNAWAAHATASKPSRKGNSAGRWLDPFYFGQLVQRCELVNEARFLERVELELLPRVEGVRAHLFEKYPATKDYVAQYPIRMAQGIEAAKRAETK